MKLTISEDECSATLNGLRLRAEAAKSFPGCKGCYLDDNEEANEAGLCAVVPCMKFERQDNTDVIWIKAE